MKTRFAPVLLFLIALSVNACNRRSPLSDQGIEDLSVLSADVKIYQDLKDKQQNSVVVFLHDKAGKEIRNDSLKIFINGGNLEYTLKQELYYTTTSYYYTENVKTPNNRYDLEIELTNGKRYFLAEIQALKTTNNAHIVYSEKGNLNQDFLVTWSGLDAIDQLIVERSTNSIKPEEPNITYSNPLPDDTVKITGAGHYRIVQSDLYNKAETTSVISLKFSTLKTGKVNPGLLKGSTIQISGNIEKRIFF